MEKNKHGIDVIVESGRDQRTLDYLIELCGVRRVQRARDALPGNTRPYVSNLAKTLGVSIPANVLSTPRSEGREKIREIARHLAATLANKSRPR